MGMIEFLLLVSCAGAAARAAKWWFENAAKDFMKGLNIDKRH